MSDEIEFINVDDIRIDGGTQPRVAVDPDIVTEYAQVILGDQKALPPVTLFYDGSNYWLADGFHRVAAHVEANRDDIRARVLQGTQRDAILHSVGANADHGLRRTNADKRRAVQRLLDDPEWSTWSDREIARRCGVSNQFVSNLRPASVNGGQMERTVERNGSKYTVNTTAIGRRDRASTDKAPSSPSGSSMEAAVHAATAPEVAQLCDSDIGELAAHVGETVAEPAPQASSRPSAAQRAPLFRSQKFPTRGKKRKCVLNDNPHKCAHALIRTFRDPEFLLCVAAEIHAKVPGTAPDVRRAVARPRRVV